MKRFLDYTVLVVILLLALGPPARGAEWNPTASDSNGNTAGGSGALVDTAGEANTAFGYQALDSNTTGNLNTASGSQALYNNTSGYDNTASGSYALRSNTTGSSNTASGHAAMHGNTTGGANTA